VVRYTVRTVSVPAAFAAGTTTVSLFVALPLGAATDCPAASNTKTSNTSVTIGHAMVTVRSPLPPATVSRKSSQNAPGAAQTTSSCALVGVLPGGSAVAAVRPGPDHEAAGRPGPTDAPAGVAAAASPAGSGAISAIAASRDRIGRSRGVTDDECVAAPGRPKGSTAGGAPASERVRASACTFYVRAARVPSGAHRKGFACRVANSSGAGAEGVTTGMACDEDTQVCTDERRRAFERAWPAVEAGLRRVLAARRVPDADHDDFLQEVAARAFASGDLTFTSADELLPWASTVLRRLHVDACRRDRRLERSGAIDDVGAIEKADPADVAVEVAARMELDAVAKAMAGWSPDSRRVLLSSDAEGTRRPSAFYVRRHRLRMKLLAAVDGLGALWGGVLRRFDPATIADRVRAADSVQSAATALAAPVAAAACAVALLFGVVVPFAQGSEGDGSGGGASDAGARRGISATPAAAVTPLVAQPVSTGPVADGPPRRPQPPEAEQPPLRKKESLVPPVERQRVEAPGAAGYEPTVEVTNEQGPQPLWCYRDKPILGDGCVGEAIYVPI
jgi:DNA-directed RNA polymerase specialized sigma24 family protein